MYQFHYFNPIHILMLLVCIFLGYFVLKLPSWTSMKPKKIANILGVFTLCLVVYECVYRVLVENFTWGQIAPFHFCSASVIAAGLYLWRGRDLYFQIAYYFSFGALLAMLLPGLGRYENQQYVVLFMLTHGFVLFAVLYGWKWLGNRPSFWGCKAAMLLSVVLFAISFVWNPIFFTNFMFTEIYIVPFLNFIQPFWLYQLLLIPSFLGIIYLMYLPFKKKNKSSQ